MRIPPLAAVAAVIAAVALAVTAPTGHAEPVGPAAGPAFYVPPDPLPPGRPGDIVRFEQFNPALPVPAKVTRIMYRSTDTHGAPNAVTGAVFDPVVPWRGSGPRPLVSFAAGTYGQGDQCAPSRLESGLIHYTPPLDVMASYEQAFIELMLGQGIAVTMTDYEGLGTPGVHTYLNPIAEGRAVIDAARAAQRLKGSSITYAGQVAFWGYSQGGGAVAGAAEQVDNYAPELNVVGTYAGAVPANGRQLVQLLDDGLWRGLNLQLLNGLEPPFPETTAAIDAILNDDGKRMAEEAKDMCAPEILARTVLQPSSTFTKNHRPLAQNILENRLLRNRIDQFKLGTARPSMPVMVATGGNDDIVPPSGARQLARDWCALGAPVKHVESPVSTLLPGTGAGHVLNALYLNPLDGNQWLLDRFAHNAAPSNC